MTVLILLKK